VSDENAILSALTAASGRFCSPGFFFLGFISIPRWLQSAGLSDKLFFEHEHLEGRRVVFQQHTDKIGLSIVICHRLNLMVQ
jgi:hypothetical protein